MDITAAVLGAGLILFVGSADVRQLVGQGADRRHALARQVGANVTIVDAGDARSVTGLVRGISRQHVRLRTVGSEVQIPIRRVSEVWEGRRLLHRW